MREAPLNGPDRLECQKKFGLLASDFESRLLEVAEETLPFDDFSFDMVLSADHLFTGDAQHDTEYHLRCIREWARVGKEVRIFPLIDRNGQPSKLLGPVLLGLQQANYGVEIREVPVQDRPGAYAMLRVWARECRV